MFLLREGLEPNGSNKRWINALVLSEDVLLGSDTGAPWATVDH